MEILPEAIRRVATLWLERYGTHTRRRYALEWIRIALWVRSLPPGVVWSWEDPDYGLVAEYARFLSAPPATWCGTRRPQDDPNWRPLVGPLDPETVDQAMAALASLYGFALKEGSAYRNPFTLWRDRKPGVTQATARRALSEVELDALAEAIRTLPTGNDQECFVQARAQLIFDLGLLLGLRISEIASSRMENISRVRLGETTAWFWRGIGKGAKRAEIPVPDGLLEDLERYRGILGLPPRPEPGETTPLLRRSRSEGAGLSVRHVRQIFYDIATRAEAASSDTEIRSALAAASPHWLRHTYVTRLIERNAGVVDLDTVHNARHTRLETTLLYAHSDQLRRYVAVRDLSWGR